MIEQLQNLINDRFMATRCPLLELACRVHNDEFNVKKIDNSTYLCVWPSGLHVYKWTRKPWFNSKSSHTKDSKIGT